MHEEKIRFTKRQIDFIQHQRVARLATSDASGHPTLVPVCYAFDDHYFYIPLDEKPKSIDARKLKRVRNIEARHEAALLIDQYSDDWSQLGYLLVHGRAELAQPGDSRHTTALPLLRARYAQYQMMALENLPVIVITLERVAAWGPVFSQA